MRIASFFAAFALSTSVFAARVDVDVPGMTCNMCIEAITKELKATEKAENISVNIETKKVRFDDIKGKKISDAEIKSAIKKAGYDVAKIQRH